MLCFAWTLKEGAGCNNAARMMHEQRPAPTRGRGSRSCSQQIDDISPLIKVECQCQCQSCCEFDLHQSFRFQIPESGEEKWQQHFRWNVADERESECSLLQLQSLTRAVLHPRPCPLFLTSYALLLCR